MFVRIIDPVVICPSPHLGIPVHPSTPEVLRVEERTPTPSSSIIFIFGLTFESFKECGGNQYLSKQDFQTKSLCLKNVLNSKKPSFFVMVSKRQWHYNNEFPRAKFGLLQRQLLLAWTLLWVHVWWINEEDIGFYHMLWLQLLIFHSTWKLRF